MVVVVVGMGMGMGMGGVGEGLGGRRMWRGDYVRGMGLDDHGSSTNGFILSMGCGARTSEIPKISADETAWTWICLGGSDHEVYCQTSLKIVEAHAYAFEYQPPHTIIS